MSKISPRTVRPGSPNSRKTRRTETSATGNVNKLVGTKDALKPRIAPSVLDHGFHTDKYKTYYSAWTPVINSTSNSQIFIERLDLIGHWLSMWTDAQRKHFLTFVLKKCTKSQLRFVNEGWFKKHLPILHLDYTTVLPRFLSTYILSFLDPRSLCRAAQVSWHWKFLSECDEIWMPKCLRFGWYLPYTPSSLEHGAWKHHYIMCTATLDMESPSRMAVTYGQFADASGGLVKEKEKVREKKTRGVKELKSYRKETRRPPWLDTDPRPSDLENAAKALLYRHNPNQPFSADSLRAERLGLSTKSLHKRSLTAPAHMRTEKVTAYEDDVRFEGRDVNGNIVEEGKQPLHPSKLTLTEALAVESGVDQPFMEQLWPKSAPTSSVRRQDLTIGVHPSLHESMLVTPRSQDYRTLPNPAVIFISSEIPACELLLESVMFGVIPIPYEYEGSTLDVLLEKLRVALQGIQAKSIGLFAWGDCGTVRVVKGETLSLGTVNEPNMRYFWETLCGSVLPRHAGGHVDIFIPLVETEPGMDLLVQLGLLTDMQFSCPTGLTGSYARVESEWLYVPDDVTPPSLYFNVTKLGAWSTTVDYIEECVGVVKANLTSFFNEERRNLAKRLVGQITFESLGVCNVYRVSEIASVLVDAIVSLGSKTGAETLSDPVEELIECLQNRGQRQKNARKVRRRKESHGEGQEDDDEIPSDGTDDDPLTTGTEEDFLKPGLSADEKRTMIAHELLSTEVAYMKSLLIIRDVFKKPLYAALASNRAIISLANLQSLFADSETLLALSSTLVGDLSSRLGEWDSHQTVGDILLKFTSQLRAYTNFLNNYPVTLQTLERCKLENPHFRSFLGRHEKQPNTRMLSLPELFLLPGRRIKSYVELLESLLTYTPSDHVDSKNLVHVITKLKDLDGLFRQYKERLDREKFFHDLQKRIVNCPEHVPNYLTIIMLLAERSRHFICEEDVILLSPPNIGKETKPEFRVYQQIGDIGLFLFNDSLLVATLTFKFLPFQRLVQRNYKFQACVSLKKLKVENLADSKYVKNAFTIVSQTRMWICQAHSWDQKYRWMSILETSITAALERL